MQLKYADAINGLRKDLSTVVAKLQANPVFSKLLEILQGLNALEKLEGVEQTLLSTVFNGNRLTEKVTKKMDVGLGDFLAMKPIKAAQEYLQKCSDARPFSEIVQVVNEGSCEELTADQERKLRRSLLRSTLRVIRIGDRFGHLDNYPEEQQKRRRKGKQRPPEVADNKEPISEVEEGAGQPTIRKRSRIKERR